MAAPKRTGLGRGIGALIPTDLGSPARPVDVFFPTSPAGLADVASDQLVSVPGARLANLSPDDILPNAAQPRTTFVQEDLEELVVHAASWRISTRSP